MFKDLFKSQKRKPKKGASAKEAAAAGEREDAQERAGNAV
jgi:hypothetical protein